MKFGKHKHFAPFLERQRLNLPAYYIKKEITQEEKDTISKYNDEINYALSGKRFEDLIKKIDNRWNESATMKALFNSLFYPMNEEQLKKDISKRVKQNVIDKQNYIRRSLGYISFEDYKTNIINFKK